MSQETQYRESDAKEYAVVYEYAESMIGFQVLPVSLDSLETQVTMVNESRVAVQVPIDFTVCQ